LALITTLWTLGFTNILYLTNPVQLWTNEHAVSNKSTGSSRKKFTAPYFSRFATSLTENKTKKKENKFIS
jgi:hypothetical protein